MKKIFEYTLDTCNSYFEQMRTVHGVIYAKNFSKAMAKLEYYYDNIDNVKLIATAAEGLDPYEFERGTIGFSLIVNENGDIIDG